MILNKALKLIIVIEDAHINVRAFHPQTKNTEIDLMGKPRLDVNQINVLSLRKGYRAINQGQKCAVCGKRHNIGNRGYKNHICHNYNVKGSLAKNEL